MGYILPLHLSITNTPPGIALDTPYLNSPAYRFEAEEQNEGKDTPAWEQESGVKDIMSALSAVEHTA